MSRNDSQFKLRLPRALHARLGDTARENKRSINAEVVTRLEQSFVGSEAPRIADADTSLAEAVVELNRKFAAICEHLGIKFDS